jgi:thiamine kinase-like enzyme
MSTQAAAWREVPAFMNAIKRLLPIAAATHTPLVFSNGDYNPANFLSDGSRLTGLVDFAHARFEDPYVGLAKYVGYDWIPFNVERLLDHFWRMHNLDNQDIALRIAVACLWLLRHCSPTSQEQQAYRARIMQRLITALHELDA